MNTIKKFLTASLPLWRGRSQDATMNGMAAIINILNVECDYDVQESKSYVSCAISYFSDIENGAIPKEPSSAIR